MEGDNFADMACYVRNRSREADRITFRFVPIEGLFLVGSRAPSILSEKECLQIGEIYRFDLI
jgi:hypothetical protein